uniref:root allergen protein-like n=1 Tax=Erigeron canadensis TaxID=72917 RepID=UPI001CB8EF9F|nr:root allergen protein-like [Erigeron canadensis]
MAVVTAVIEVPSSLPAPKLFKLLITDFTKLAPIAEPQTYKSVTTIDGVNHVTFSDECKFNSAKIRFDAMDAEKLTVSYTIIEGDTLLGKVDNAPFHVEFIPSADGGCVYKQTMVFNCKGDSKLSEEEIKETKEWYTNTVKVFEAYAIAHPEVC